MPEEFFLFILFWIFCIFFLAIRAFIRNDANTRQLPKDRKAKRINLIGVKLFLSALVEIIQKEKERKKERKKVRKKERKEERKKESKKERKKERK